MRYAPCALETVLAHKSALVKGFSLSALKDDLADSNARFEHERKRSEIPDLQNLPVVDARLNETCGHVNDQSHSSKTAPSFQPATDIGRKSDPFMGDS